MFITISPRSDYGGLLKCFLCEQASLDPMIQLAPAEVKRSTYLEYTPPRVICADCVRGMAEALRHAGVEVAQ